MRLWSLHPGLLDAKGLTACWREGLLAQAVLTGKTKGYTNHPQLQRFRAQKDPVASLQCFLSAVVDEAAARGYSFDRTKIRYCPARPTMTVTRGQLEFEFAHLKKKLKQRDPARLKSLPIRPKAHPMFRVVAGGVADWERP